MKPGKEIPGQAITIHSVGDKIKFNHLNPTGQSKEEQTTFIGKCIFILLEQLEYYHTKKT